MSCCKSKTDVIKENPELTIKYVLKKGLSILLVSIFLVILTPFIIIMVWYLGLKMIVGDDSDYISMIGKKFNLLKDKPEPTEEFNPDDYELADVEVIK